MRLWVSSFLPVRASAAAYRSIQQGTSEAVVIDVFRGDPVSKEVILWGIASELSGMLCFRKNCFKVLDLGITVLVFG